MIINRSGILIRMAVTDMRVMGRATQGVRLIKVRENDAIASVARVEIEDEAEQEISEEIVSEDNTVAPDNDTVESDDES